MEQGPQKGTTALFTMRVLWAAMFFTQFTFLGILAVNKGVRPEDLSVGDFARAEFLIFALMGIINAIVGYLLPKFLVKGSLRGRVLKNEVEVLQVTFPAMIIRL